MLQNIPYFDMIPPNSIAKCSILHCRRIAPTLFPPWGNNRADTIRPYTDGATELPRRNLVCQNLWHAHVKNGCAHVGAPEENG